jgi:hypothetical protein
MKIWCIFKMNTAIKRCELLVVDEPHPLALSIITLLGKLLLANAYVDLDNFGG